MSHQDKRICNGLSNFIGRFRKQFAPITAALLAGSLMLPSANVAAEPSMEALQKVLKGQIGLMKPELQEKVQGLSQDTKMSLMAILAMHNRYSNEATMRQVMLEVFADYQSMAMGIMTDSTEMTADSARRLANHRIPVGGLLPYLGMENITDDRLAVLDGFNSSVEGNAIKLAAAADAGDMATAASLLGEISSGCVACHTVFRSKPGQSDLLR
ncbi:MAG: hypothetical protein ABW148_04150 [Sedimenticola sp.]